MLRFIIILVATLFATVHDVSGAYAQTYPTRTVRIIVPYGPASGADITTRLIGARLAARWGKPVVIENRPGGDSLVAINAFVSANDDYTLLYAPAGVLAVHPYSHAKLPYDVDRDLLPIANVAMLVFSAATPASLNVHSLREFVELVRAQPGKYNAAAAAGNAEFLLAGFVKEMNLSMAEIPYRDIMQGPGDLAEGRIQFLITALVTAQPMMQAGKINILAVTGRERATSAPDVPTVREAGYPALEMESIQGFFGPRSMSIETRDKIAADVRAVIDADPTIAPRLATTGQVLDFQGPAEFALGIKAMRDRIAKIANNLGIKAAVE